MAGRLLISTRKGLFSFTSTGGAWRLDHHTFPGHPVVYTFADRRDDSLYASLNLGHFGPKLHRSGDGGATWQELPTPAFSPNADQEDAPSIVQIWTLAAAGPTASDGLWAGSIPGGLFRSYDCGESWQLNDALWNLPERKEWMGGGYDQPGIHSICVDPRDKQRVSVAISTGGVWLSKDGGESWALRTEGLRAAYLPPDIANGGVLQDVHAMVQCAGAPDRFWVQHHNGIFHSSDYLASWREITPQNSSAFGFAVAVHPHDGKTAWFIPAIKDEFRYPADGKFFVTRTRDGGASFEILDQGLPSVPAYDLVYRHGLVVDDTGNHLALGSTTGGAWTSDDGGEHWHMLPFRLPPINAVAFA